MNSDRKMRLAFCEEIANLKKENSELKIKIENLEYINDLNIKNLEIQGITVNKAISVIAEQSEKLNKVNNQSI